MVDWGTPAIDTSHPGSPLVVDTVPGGPFGGKLVFSKSRLRKPCPDATNRLIVTIKSQSRPRPSVFIVGFRSFYDERITDRLKGGGSARVSRGFEFLIFDDLIFDGVASIHYAIC